MCIGMGCTNTNQTVLRNFFESPNLNAARMSVKTGDFIFEVGAPANEVWLIISGQIHVRQVSSDEQVRLIEIVGPGDWIGSASLARLSAHTLQTVAAAPSELLEAPAEKVLAALPHHPEVNQRIIRDLVAKLDIALRDSSSLVFNDCNHRLIATLLRFSQSAAATPVEGGISLRLTHSQLAQAVGVARETITLALTDLRRRHLLTTGRNQVIFNPDQLRDAARGPLGTDSTSPPEAPSRFDCAPAPWPDTGHDRPAPPAPRHSKAGSV